MYSRSEVLAAALKRVYSRGEYFVAALNQEEVAGEVLADGERVFYCLFEGSFLQTGLVFMEKDYLCSCT